LQKAINDLNTSFPHWLHDKFFRLA